MKSSHSKLVNLEYTELKLQDYLKSNDFTVEEARTVFVFRTKMANFENSLEESFLTLCEFRLRKSLESASNNDNKTPTASSVEQVSLLATRSNT